MTWASARKEVTITNAPHRPSCARAERNAASARNGNCPGKGRNEIVGRRAPPAGLGKRVGYESGAVMMRNGNKSLIIFKLAYVLSRKAARAEEKGK